MRPGALTKTSRKLRGEGFAGQFRAIHAAPAILFTTSRNLSLRNFRASLSGSSSRDTTLHCLGAPHGRCRPIMGHTPDGWRRPLYTVRAVRIFTRGNTLAFARDRRLRLPSCSTGPTAPSMPGPTPVVFLRSRRRRITSTHAPIITRPPRFAKKKICINPKEFKHFGHESCYLLIKKDLFIVVVFIQI